jgi:hypothetical protein
VILTLEMDIRTLLLPDTVLVANPHRYDYIHHFELRRDGSVEMVDGACQALRRRIIGRYEIVIHDALEGEVRFHDVRDVDPYERSPETRDIEPFSVHVVVEAGPFAHECETVWHVKPNEEPYVIHPSRLVFAFDPLGIGAQPFPEFPPEALEIPEIKNFVESHRRSVESSRRYYVTRDRVELPFHELQKLGLPPDRVVPLSVSE